MARTGPLLFAGAFALCFIGRVNSEYLGKFIGKLSELHHGVSGEVYAVDGRTIHIKDYTYDGQGPAAYFYASTFKAADSRGFRLRDENNNGDVIRRYRKEGVTLTLPEGKTLNNIKIFYVWCEEFDVNFGDVKIPRNFDFPRPQKIDALKGVHSISSDNIVIVDAQTLLIPNLHYDGEAPDAKFWVGRGPKPSPQGIRVPDENGKELPLRRYDGKTVVLTLPGDLTVFDIGHFGIWCEQFTVDFGHIQIPQGLNIPPSLKMLGVSPQSKLNCEVLDDDSAFEVRWAVAGESIVLQLVAKLDDREYMSFGLSGDVSKSVMIGGDVVVAWVDRETLKGFAQDYYLADKSQCSGPTGSCPDNRFVDETNNARLLNAAMVNGYSIVTYQRPLKASDQYDLPIYTNQSQAIIWAIGPLNQRDEVSFHSKYLKRDAFIDFGRPAKWNCPLPEGETPGKPTVVVEQNKPQDSASEEPPIEPKITRGPEQYEEPVEPATTAAPRREANRRRGGGTRRQPAVNTEVAEEGQATSRETTRTRGNNRVSQRNAQTVPPPTPVKERDAWYIPPIECYEPEDGVFYAQMGPTGGKRGYSAITGHVGWGISWYINGLLIPEINVVRGKTYNFITEGGDNPDIPAKYHPFYITDDPIGGYVYKTPEEKKNVTIFSGVRFDKNGEAVPTGTGRLCHWTHTGDSDADDFESFGAYQRTLQLKCDQGEPGVIQWTPDSNTPDTVYYQCFTHRYLGWKINVHNTCHQGSASEIQSTIVEAPSHSSFKETNFELDASPSIRQETMVIPNVILIANPKPDNRSQPTLSETLITLDEQSTPTSQQKYDQIPHTSLSFQIPQSHNTIHPLGQMSSFARPHSQAHTLGPFTNYQALNFRATPTRDLTRNVKTTQRPLIKLPLEMFPQSITKHHKQVYYYPPQTKNKKPLHRQPPSQKLYSSVVYNVKPELKLNPIFKTPSQNNHQLLSSYPMTLQVPIQTQSVSETSVVNSLIKNIEISPQQASTEKEPETSTLLTIHSPEISEEENNQYHKSENKGFKPESIVIERGFKPIITTKNERESEDRIDQIEPEIDPEGEIGVISIKNEKKFETLEDMDPALITSSNDKQPSKKPNRKVTQKNKIKTKDIVKVIVRTRSLIESDIEPEVAAADRIESYYLPALGQTDKPQMKVAKAPSAIDFEVPSVSNGNSKASSQGSNSKLAASPPDIVVTFDGKRVSGASLTAKPFEKAVAFERGSKATEFLKAHPQSVPFRGDLPPLNSHVLFNSNPHHPISQPAVLNRDLDTPISPPSSGSTKLTRVRRHAHHTPEHTEQQRREMNQTVASGSVTNRFHFVNIILVVVLLLMFRRA